MDGYKESNNVYPVGSGTRNGGALPAYAPIPPDGQEANYKWPLAGAEGYYSLMYVGKNPVEWTRLVYTCARAHSHHQVILRSSAVLHCRSLLQKYLRQPHR